MAKKTKLPISCSIDGRTFDLDAGKQWWEENHLTAPPTVAPRRQPTADSRQPPSLWQRPLVEKGESGVFAGEERDKKRGGE